MFSLGQTKIRISTDRFTSKFHNLVDLQAHRLSKCLTKERKKNDISRIIAWCSTSIFNKSTMICSIKFKLYEHFLGDYNVT
jgi:hypothetical protein